MDSEKKLYRYIVKRFIITLLLIGITQALGNLLFAQFVNPLLSTLLGTSALARGAGLMEGVLLVIVILVARVTTPGAAVRMASFLGTFFHVDMERFGVTIADESIFGNMEGKIELFLIFCCLFVMVMVWILPYVIGGLSFAVSVSNRVRDLEAKRIERDRETERQKNLLLSDVAHDLKTPITTMAGFSQALVEGNVAEEKKQEYLEAIRTKSMQTVDMVTLLFEYVKLDSAGFTLHKTTEDVCEIDRGLIAKWYTDFEEKGMELEFDLPEESIFMQVDKIQLERAISNILVNALKHNDQGTKIWISLSKENNWLSLKISDNGQRIETETAKHLFDPFVQGDKSRTGGKGSGLGLSITRKIVEMHGGRVRLIQYKEPKDIVKSFEVLLRL